MKIKKFIRDLLNAYLFIKYNKKKFKKIYINKKNIILIDQFNYHPSMIPYSYFVNILCKKYESKAILYENYYRQNFFRRIFNFFKDMLPFSYFSVYKSFGIERKFYTTFNENIRYKASLAYFREIEKIKRKEDILKIKLEKVEIGELLYDFYLSINNIPTINISEKRFKDACMQFFLLFYFWHDYLNKNRNIKALIVSHDTYHYAIPLRIAIGLEIPCYTVAHGQCFFLDKQNIRKKTRFSEYNNEFNKLSSEIKKIGILKSQEILKQKFSGELTFDKANNEKVDVNLFSKSNTNINFSKKKKILVATHCFTDAIHAYGETLFTDFYDWIDFVGKKTLNSDYQWLLKAHPAQYEKNLEHLKYFEKKYEKFLLLPKNISHFELIDNNIIGVLTMYGSIGYEYPYFGIPVINATNNNPHISYNFNYYPRSKDDYSKLIDDIEKLKFDKNKYRSEIYEYYFSNFLKDYYFFKDHIRTVEQLGENYSSPLVYREWINNLSEKKDSEIKEKVKKFLDSKLHRFLKDNH